MAIREFARRAALLADEATETLDPETRQLLVSLNQPSRCFSRRGYRVEVPSGHFDHTEGRFNFDSTDTIPYWLDDAGDVFGLSGRSIAERAEKWIVDYLGLGNDDVWSDSRELRAERRWSEMRNYHGSIPVLDGLRTYLEYHSMLLAVGELTDEGTPVSVETYDDAGDPLEEWLSRHIEISANSWLADLRSSAPLDPLVYHELGPLDEWSTRTDEDFEHELGLHQRDGWLIVESWKHVWDTDRHGSSGVMTALVSAKTASALVRAFQTADSPYDYALPWEPADPRWRDDEIEEREFVLLGWLEEISHDRGSVEEHDPLRRISAGFTLPGVSFRENVDAEPDASGVKLIDAKGETVAEVEMWSDDIGDRRDRIVERYTEGRATWVARSALVEFLDARGLDLIIKVLIRRQIDRSRREESAYDLGTARVYVFRRDGSLETLG